MQRNINLEFKEVKYFVDEMETLIKRKITLGNQILEIGPAQYILEPNARILKETFFCGPHFQ
jgi:hypothetical protein